MSFEGRLFGGRYRGEQLLGQGGFGVVLRALDVNTGRPVALKLLRGSDLDESMRARFQREARVVQTLAHPNTVRLFDFGADADGTPFIVYELLDGETLAQIMRQGPIPLDRTLRIGAQVLKALSEAHEKGIVHRDIKPANVMVVQFSGDRDVVKVLDFGIAKPLLGASKVLTQTGVLVGTPRFMSPEQVTGAAVRPSSDVYSVGLLLLEMLTGARVFVGSALEVMTAQLDPEPVPIPPSIRASPLGDVLARALEKDPKRRFASAHEMLAALEDRLKAPSIAPTLGGSLAVYGTAARAPAESLPPRRTRTVPVVLLAAGGAGALLLVLAAVTMVAYLVLQRKPAEVAKAEPAASGAKVSPALNEATGATQPALDARLPSFDVQRTSETLAKEGWRQIDRSNYETGGSIAMDNGTRHGSILFKNFRNEEEARGVAFENPASVAVARFGSTVAWFSLVVGDKLDPKSSRDWRDHIVGLLRTAQPAPAVPTRQAPKPAPKRFPPPSDLGF